MKDDRSLTPKQAAFVDEYLIDLNATQAAIRAGYSERTANEQSARLLANVSVRKHIQARMDKRARDTGITAERVLQEIHDIAMADPRELVQVKVSCCRHCWGDGHRYQRTVGEMNRDREEWGAAGKALEEFDEQGGIGFDVHKGANPECPECAGDGEPRVVIQDTRNLSRAAAALFAGAKMGKHGLEISLHPKEKALEMLGRHLKLFTDKVEHDVSDALADRIKAARERSKR